MKSPAPALDVEVRVSDLRQLFVALDPRPPRERDLDPRAECLLNLSRNGRDPSVGLVLCIDGGGAHDGYVPYALKEYFLQGAQAARRRLRERLRSGAIGLAAGAVFLAGALLMSLLLPHWLAAGSALESARLVLYLLGALAVWRPLGVFLYDWWPMLGEARLFERLASLPVRVRGPG